jgi:hypothetical protein
MDRLAIPPVRVGATRMPSIGFTPLSPRGGMLSSAGSVSKVAELSVEAPEQASLTYVCLGATVPFEELYMSEERREDPLQELVSFPDSYVVRDTFPKAHRTEFGAEIEVCGLPTRLAHFLLTTMFRKSVYNNWILTYACASSPLWLIGRLFGTTRNLINATIPPLLCTIFLPPNYQKMYLQHQKGWLPVS